MFLVYGNTYTMYTITYTCYALGHYWIDPNEGSNKDAIQVYCQGPETCVTPQSSTTANKVHIINNTAFLNAHSFMQINFENEISLRFLKLKYINARQNITYDCSNGIEAFEKLQLLTNNGNMIKYGDKQLRVVSEVRMYMCMYSIM